MQFGQQFCLISEGFRFQCYKSTSNISVQIITIPLKVQKVLIDATLAQLPLPTGPTEIAYEPYSTTCLGRNLLSIVMISVFDGGKIDNNMLVEFDNIPVHANTICGGSSLCLRGNILDEQMGSHLRMRLLDYQL